MIVERIKEYPDLIKKDNVIVLNTDRSAYNAALKRKQVEQEKKDLVKRVAVLEQLVRELIANSSTIGLK